MGQTGIAGAFSKADKMTKDFAKSAGEASPLLNSMTKMLTAAGGGARANFPQVWKGSSFSSSYSISPGLFIASFGSDSLSK